jgi:uncharacterized protein (DUF427 family)/catechol 2,3-dioxygenase-like lactoylglutathione lyase family enzyme
MSTLLHTVLTGAVDRLRHEPTAARVRAALGDATVVDSTRALLVWEPHQIVPGFAVPAPDIDAELVPAAAGASGSQPHTADGELVAVRGGARSGWGLRLADPDLAGYVLLEFTSFDRWWEEDEPIASHPHDPFHRIDVRASSRHVRLELDGEVLAESSRSMMLFETLLPTRYYLPREDVAVELVPTETETACAYKGRAAYFSARVGGRLVRDLAWTIPDPLPEGERIGGLVAFFNERIDVVVDGRRVERPVNPWRRRPSDASEAEPAAAGLPAPREGILVTQFLAVRDVARSRDFYSRVLGGTVVMAENPCIVRLANSWVIMNPGGPPTPDKPGISVVDHVAGPTTSAFMNLRVADVGACYKEWSSKGAEFLTPPLDRGAETRCYLRDPDGYLIEVGQSTGLLRGEHAAKRPEDLPG